MSHATSPSSSELDSSRRLANLVAGTSNLIGEAFFGSFVKNLADAYGATFAIANELIDLDPKKVRTLAFWQNGQLGANFEYEVKTTPCECVYNNGLSYFPRDIQSIFAEDADLISMGVHSYYGIPLSAQNGETIGHICILGPEPLAETDVAEAYFKIFSARASSELQRLKAENELVRHRDYLKLMVDEQTESLIKAKNVAERASQAKTEFLSRMSHELNTPMNAILGYVELLQEDMTHFDETHQEYLSNIQNAGWRLHGLVSEILDISKIERGEIQTNIVQCDLESIIDECNKKIMPKASSHGITFTYGKQNTANSQVMADQSRLKQVVSNLLSNAVKYNKENGSVTIEINPQDNNFTRISVSDTGPGISEKDKLKVFEKFERLDADAKCIEGTGVGLAITKRLVEHMNGNIGLDSEPEKGSTFWIELPTA